MNKILILLIFVSLNTQARELWCGNDSRLKPKPEVVASPEVKIKKPQFGKVLAQAPSEAKLEAKKKRLQEQKEAKAVADTVDTPFKETEN